MRMKQVIKFSLNNKFALLNLTFIITGAGIFSSVKMKTEMFPVISIPVVTVTASYLGTALDEVIEKVSKPIELQTSHLPGVTAVSSSSTENASPVGVQAPRVSRVNINALPVLTLLGSYCFFEYFSGTFHTINSARIML